MSDTPEVILGELRVDVADVLTEIENHDANVEARLAAGVSVSENELKEPLINMTTTFVKSQTNVLKILGAM